MRATFLVAAAMVMTCSGAMAQNGCAAFSGAIESALKQAAADLIEGVADNSAPRASLRELRVANSLATIRINVDLMAQNKCPPRQTPVDTSYYTVDAFTCEMDTRKGVKDAPTCNQANWRGMATKP